MTAFTSSTDGPLPAWWFLQCERNHGWWRLLPPGVEPVGVDARCPEDGSDAVTASPRQLADRVIVQLIPAAWEREGSVGFENEFFLEVSDRRGTRSLKSGRSFEWNEAVKRMEWLKGLTWEEAQRRWVRVGLNKKDSNKMVSEIMELWDREDDTDRND